MNPKKSPPPEDATEEVTALVETLLETEQRLEELTAGDVRTVTYPKGRTFLLWRAQEQLHHTEAAKQTAILNALPAHIALLDTQGIIISANEAWRRFAGAHLLQGPGYEVGLNYLEICDRARGDDASAARQVAAGIRSVLSGAVKNFSLEYPCHSPTEQRWFLLTATPLAEDLPNGAVVMHTDVTTKRQTAESLRVSEWRFRQMADNIREAFFLRDANGDRVLYISAAYEEIWGRSCESLYANPESWSEAIHPDDRASTFERNKEGMLAGKFEFEYRIVRPDGSIRWIESKGFPVRDDAGKIIRIAGVAADITERKQAEEGLQHSQTMARMAGRLSRMGAWSVDLPGFKQTWSDEVCAIHEVPPGCAPTVEESLNYYAPEFRETITRNFGACVRDGTPFDAELQIITARGRHIWVRSIGEAERDAAGVIRRVQGALQDISERKRTEESLRANQANMAAAQSIAHFGSWELELTNSNDVDANALRWSDEMFRIAGYEPGAVEVSNELFFRLVPWDEHEPIRQAVAKAISERQQYSIVHRLIRPDGEERSVHELARIFLDQKTGQPTKMVGTAHDITERKRSENALRESEERFSGAFEFAPIGVALVSPDGRWIKVNRALCDLVGYSEAELLSRTFQQITHHEDLDADLENVRRLIAGEIHAYQMEKRYVHARGHLVTVLLNVSLVRDGQGQPLYFISQIQDITERKRAAQELRESERRFSDMLGNVELVAMMLDREAQITYCNDYLLRLTGWRREEVLGREWFDLFIPAGHDDAKDIFSALLADLPSAAHPENEILTRSGERRLIRWNNSVLRSGAGDVIGTASIGEDITERKEAEDRIAFLNRVYAMLSGINALIVRVRDRDELFREACRIAVVEGGFRMSLIGMVDRSTMMIVPVASAGKDEELLSAIKGLVSSREIASSTMVARAIREKKAVVSNDSQDDPQVLLGDKYTEAGVRSMAILPLIVSDEAIGVLALYAGKTEFFHEGELNLLTDLAGDIAFAIDHIDKQERLDYLAYYDALTGLANRALFHERLQQSVVSAHERRRSLALVLLDIERFKTINDTLGRPAGDALLKELAARLAGYAADVGRLARIDADHFALMVPDMQSGEELARLIEQRVGEVFRPPFRVGDAELRVSGKFGIAMFPGDGTDADTLFRNAEAALKNAKARGERYLFYTQTMNERVAEKLTLENQLRQALDKGEFVLHYQPKVNLASGKLTSAEALIRWNDPRTGLVPPGLFIPILEETGLIHEVGRWAMGKAIEDYLRWRAADLAAVRIAVNVSPLQLRNRGFVAEIERAIGIDALAAVGLELEITESLIMEDVKHSIASLQAIRAMGVTIAIDDFGTGFSSLSYLAKLPVDTLKIDRSFVINMTAGPQGLALVSTIINLAHALKLKVVAEGVETEEQSHLLRLLNCDEMQGFLFSKAVPVEIFETRFLAPPPPGGPGCAVQPRIALVI